MAAFGWQTQERKPVEAALEIFQTVGASKLETALEKVWTPPAAAEAVSAALAAFDNSVPEGGEVKLLDAGDRRKIAAIQPVLYRFKRQQLQVRVISISQAYVGLYQRAIILVSQPALQLLKQEELQAMAAHEVAHDLIWAKWEAARAANDRRSLQELELFCDGFAVLALHALHVDLSRWLASLEKIATYNRRRFGEVANDDGRYPSMSDRRKFAQTFIRRIRELEQTNGQQRNVSPVSGPENCAFLGVTHAHRKLRL